MAAPAARRRPTPPIYMFNRYADMSQLTGEPAGERWIEMEFDSKKAYGCGENIQEAVKGLSFYARLGNGDPLIDSSLAIRMTDEALRRFEEELERGVRPPRPGFQPETTAWAHILTHAPAEGLTVITLHFHRRYYRELDFILVFDHRRASLSVVEPVDAPCVVRAAVPRRTRNGDYELFYMAYDRVDNPFAHPPNVDPVPLLCVFSPASAGANANPAASAWEMRRNMRWSVPVSVEHRFRPDMSFSFQGKGVWVDLTQGLKYCDLEVDTAAGDSVVEFVELPRECVLDLKTAINLYLEEAMELTRTVSCDGDSIWFVCIDDQSISDDDCADNLVSMWTLKLLDGGKQAGQWKKEAEFCFSLRDLWGFDGFKEAGLPEAPVGYPLLNAADGVLYLVLSGEYLGPSDGISWVDHMCSFDLRNKRLLWHRIVHNFPVTLPAVVPSCFFQTELARDPAAGLTSLLQPGTKQRGVIMRKDIKEEELLQPGTKQRDIMRKDIKGKGLVHCF